ncbi:MAG TPA: hypothetical protein VD995_30675 [Azospirillum sp.]|nr:hypothetical protein [Azospirillum sp.]
MVLTAMVERVILLLFILGRGGPTTVDFDTYAQCEAARPQLVAIYQDMTGNEVFARCVALKLPAK